MTSFLAQMVPPLWGKKRHINHMESETPRNKSWASADGVITGLSHFELCLLNAQEERVLPAEMKIKIVMAQEQPFAREALVEDVKRLNGMVRTLALYGLLEGKRDGLSRFSSITSVRIQELGKMLVAAVQLELFRMLDEICVAADVENELFDDLCCDVIQTGALEGFVLLTLETLLSPGSGYKRLLQIRKDQMVEGIASQVGLDELAGHDCGTPLPRDQNASTPELDTDKAYHWRSFGSNGSPSRRRSLGSTSSSSRSLAIASAPTGIGIGGGGGEDNGVKGATGPPKRLEKTNTARMRDLLSSIDGLADDVAASEASISAMNNLPPLSPPAHCGGGPGPASSQILEAGGGISAGGGILSCRSPRASFNPASPSEGQPLDSGKLSFFPTESPQVTVVRPDGLLARGRGASVSASKSSQGMKRGGSGVGGKLLSEVDWLMAETMAALGPVRMSSVGSGLARGVSASSVSSISGGGGGRSSRSLEDVEIRTAVGVPAVVAGPAPATGLGCGKAEGDVGVEVGRIGVKEGQAPKYSMAGPASVEEGDRRGLAEVYDGLVERSEGANSKVGTAEGASVTKDEARGDVLKGMAGEEDGGEVVVIWSGLEATSSPGDPQEGREGGGGGVVEAVADEQVPSAAATSTEPVERSLVGLGVTEGAPENLSSDSAGGENQGGQGLAQVGDMMAVNGHMTEESAEPSLGQVWEGQQGQGQGENGHHEVIATGTHNEDAKMTVLLPLNGDTPNNLVAQFRVPGGEEGVADSSSAAGLSGVPPSSMVEIALDEVDAVASGNDAATWKDEGDVWEGGRAENKAAAAVPLKPTTAEVPEKTGLLVAAGASSGGQRKEQQVENSVMESVSLGDDDDDQVRLTEDAVQEPALKESSSGLRKEGLEMGREVPAPEPSGKEEGGGKVNGVVAGSEGSLLGKLPDGLDDNGHSVIPGVQQSEVELLPPPSPAGVFDAVLSP